MAVNELFKIDLPDDWSDRTVFTYEGPNDSGVQHNIIITVDRDINSTMKLPDYARQQLAHVEKALPGFTFVAQREKQLISGIPAYEIVYKFVPAEGKVLWQKQILMIIGKKGYIFTSTFIKKTMKTLALKVDEIVGSFSPVELEG